MITRRRSVEALRLRHVGEIVCARLGARRPVPGKRARVKDRPARFYTFYLAHVHYGISYRMLERVSGFHYTSVKHMVARVESWRDDPKIDALLDEIEAQLRGVTRKAVAA